MSKRKKVICKYRCIAIIGIIVGGIIFCVVEGTDTEENAVAEKTWEQIEHVIDEELGKGYYEVGQCTGFLYWCLDNAYGVEWGKNSYVCELEEKIRNEGISEVAEGTSGEVTSEMKPGDILIFERGKEKTHCAILGEAGEIYHAINSGVTNAMTLSQWMALPVNERNCKTYTVYRGLT